MRLRNILTLTALFVLLIYLYKGCDNTKKHNDLARTYVGIDVANYVHHITTYERYGHVKLQSANEDHQRELFVMLLTFTATEEEYYALLKATTLSKHAQTVKLMATHEALAGRAEIGFDVKLRTYACKENTKHYRIAAYNLSEGVNGETLQRSHLGYMASHYCPETGKGFLLVNAHK